MACMLLRRKNLYHSVEEAVKRENGRSNNHVVFRLSLSLFPRKKYIQLYFAEAYKLWR